MTGSQFRCRHYAKIIALLFWCSCLRFLRFYGNVRLDLLAVLRSLVSKLSNVLLTLGQLSFARAPEESTQLQLTRTPPRQWSNFPRQFFPLFFFAKLDPRR